MAESDAGPIGDQEDVSSFLEIDCEIFITVILSLPLIQDWSVSGNKMSTNTG